MSVTNDQFEQFKKDAFDNEPISKIVTLGEITLLDDSCIGYKGARLKLKDVAIRDLLKILGMPVTFSNAVTNVLGEDAQRKFAEIMRAGKSVNGKDTMITLVANPKTKLIVRVLKNAVLMPNKLFFETFEKIMDRGNYVIKGMSNNSEGSVSINFAKPEGEFNAGNHKDEFFFPGFALTNSVDKGARLEEFIFRLICTNGLIGGGPGDFTPLGPGSGSFTEFYDKLTDLEQTTQARFTNQVQRAMNTKASWAEIQFAANSICNYSKMQKEFVDKFVPYNHYRRQIQARLFSQGNMMDITALNKQQEKNLITDSTLWDVINGITDFASHDYGFDLHSNGGYELQKRAGMLLSRKSHDADNIVGSMFKKAA